METSGYVTIIAAIAMVAGVFISTANEPQHSPRQSLWTYRRAVRVMGAVSIFSLLAVLATTGRQHPTIDLVLKTFSIGMSIGIVLTYGLFMAGLADRIPDARLGSSFRWITFLLSIHSEGKKK